MAFNSMMHDRNIYKERPDFAKIALEYPEFRKYTLPDAKGKVRVDFTDPDALRILTKILLKKDFDLSVEIPKGFLIPTVPQRLNYILWIEDLLTVLPGKYDMPNGIDIGCGPCAIFSILGAKKNKWKFTATESSEDSLQWANLNIKANNLSSLIEVVKVNSEYTLKEVLSSKETKYDFCLCNPPFFESIEEIMKKNPKKRETIEKVAREEEILAEGGEISFVKKMVEESFLFKDRVRLFTSMFGKKKSFVEILKVLQESKDIVAFTKSQFCQGNTIRWGLAWTFLKSVCFKEIEKPKAKKPKKAKPLIFQIPKNSDNPDYNVQKLSNIIFNILKDLEILVNTVRDYEYYTESLITTDKNTWSHQRRKRREMKRNVDEAVHSQIQSPEKNNVIIVSSDNHKSLSSDPKYEDSINLSETKNSQKRKLESENSSQSTKKFKSDSSLIEDTDNVTESNHISPESNVPCSKESDSYKGNLSVIPSFTSEHRFGKEEFEILESKYDSKTENVSINTESHLKKRKHDECGDESLEKPCMNQMPVLKSVCIETAVTKVDNKITPDVNENREEIIKQEPNPIEFKTDSLLFCTLKIRKAKDLVLLEINCPPEANRESMHQIFQYLKNKLQ